MVTLFINILLIVLYIASVAAAVTLVVVWHMAVLSPDIDYLLKAEDEMVKEATKKMTTTERLMCFLPVVNIVFLIYMIYILRPLLKEMSDEIDKRDNM